MDVTVGPGFANLSKKKKQVGYKLQEKNENAWLSECYWFIIEKDRDNICVSYYVYINICFTIKS